MQPDFKHMLGRLLGPAKAEIGCDECFEQLDRYVDLQVAGHDADAALPGLRAHLARLPRLPRGAREPARLSQRAALTHPNLPSYGRAADQRDGRP